MDMEAKKTWEALRPKRPPEMKRRPKSSMMMNEMLLQVNCKVGLTVGVIRFAGVTCIRQLLSVIKNVGCKNEYIQKSFYL